MMKRIHPNNCNFIVTKNNNDQLGQRSKRSKDSNKNYYYFIPNSIMTTVFD